MSGGNGSHPLEAGIYAIQSLDSNTNVNLAVRELGQEPYVCVWKTTGSPTELWQLEPTEKGYLIRNLSTHLHISYALGLKEENGVGILGIERPVEWQIEKIDSYYVIKLASHPDLSLDVGGYLKWDGSSIIMWEFHGDMNQRWLFQQVRDERRPLLTGKRYIRAVPVGVYWLGQPFEEGGTAKVGKEPSEAALTVAAARPLGEDVVTSAHLSAVGIDGPCLNQIWAVESGLHGCRLKNIGTRSYLNCVNRVPVLVSASRGLAGITEWIFKKGPSHQWSDIPDYWISPSSDHSLILGVNKGDKFNQARLKPLSVYQEEFKKGWNYTQWRFEVVDEQFLDDPETLHPCAPEPAQPTV